MDKKYRCNQSIYNADTGIIFFKNINFNTIFKNDYKLRFLQNENNYCLYFLCYSKNLEIKINYWIIIIYCENKNKLIYKIPVDKIKLYINNNLFFYNIKLIDNKISRIYILNKLIFEKYKLN